MGRTRKAISGLALVSTLLAVAPARAVVFEVYIDTSTLTDPTNAVLAFDLTNDDPVNHRVTIDHFMSAGALLVCPTPDTCPAGTLFPDSPVVDPPGSHIVGTLPGPLTMYDDDNLAFVTYFQNITLGGAGSYISFSFEFFGDSPGDPPDGLQFSLLDTDLLPLVTDSGALLTYSFGAVPACLTFFDGVTKCAAVAEPPTVPEPGALALALAGLLAHGVLRLSGTVPLCKRRSARPREGACATLT